MKYEWRKKDKGLYLPKTEPVVMEIPTMNYLKVEGVGNPDSEAFSQCVAALYALSYGIRMAPKKGYAPEGYYEYTVFPLEGIWSLNDEGKMKYREGACIVELKDDMTYTMMIRQPEFVTSEVVEAIRPDVLRKKKSPRTGDVRFESLTEGKCVQMMHIGSYDDEPASFDRMEAYASEARLVRKGKEHKEIYLSDPSKAAPEKLKTTLRFWVE